MKTPVQEPKHLTITAYAANERNVYCITFTHPVSNQRLNKSLQTADESVAKEIALHLERICNTPDLWDFTNAVLLTLQKRAVEIFFGKVPEPPPARVPVKAGADPVKTFADVFYLFDEHVIESEELRIERIARIKAEGKVSELSAKLADQDHEIAALRRAAGKHVTVNMGDAVAAWKEAYKTGRDAHTFKSAVRDVEKFLTFVSPEKHLASVRAGDVNRWLEQFKGRVRKDEKWVEIDPSPPTKRKARAYVSSFFTWALVNSIPMQFSA